MLLVVGTLIYQGLERPRSPLKFGYLPLVQHHLL